MAERVFDWLVIGGGSAGLAVAKQASGAGSSVCLIDTCKSPDFASVRNQGWLHSGGLFCYYRDGISDVAAECQEAKALIEHVQSVSGVGIIDRTPGVALFREESHAQRWLERSLQNGIEARLLSSSALNDLFSRYGKSEFHNYAVELQDCSVDNAGFLNALYKICQSSGVAFRAEPSLIDAGSFGRSLNDEYWTLRVSENEYSGVNVAVCLGVLGPAFIERNFSARIPYRITNSYVMALNELRIDRLIISPNQQTKNLNISPFSSGTTVNCGLLDQYARGRAAPIVDLSREIETIQHLAANWPNIVRSQPSYSSYVCQKLEITDLSVEEKRKFAIRKIEDRLHFFYPGKFTTALVGARALVDGSADSGSVASIPPTAAPTTSVVDGFEYIHPGERHASDRRLDDVEN